MRPCTVLDFVQAARLSVDSSFVALLSSLPDEAALPHQCAILGTCTYMTQGNYTRGTARMTSKFVHCLFRNVETQLHTFGDLFSFQTRRYACGLFSVFHCSTPMRMPGQKPGQAGPLHRRRQPPLRPTL